MSLLRATRSRPSTSPRWASLCWRSCSKRRRPRRGARDPALRRRHRARRMLGGADGAAVGSLARCGRRRVRRPCSRVAVFAGADPLRFGAIAGVPWSFGVVALALLRRARRPPPRDRVVGGRARGRDCALRARRHHRLLGLPRCRRCWFRSVADHRRHGVRRRDRGRSLDAITGASSRPGRRVAALVGILAVGASSLAADGWAPADTWQASTHAGIGMRRSARRARPALARGVRSPPSWACAFEVGDPRVDMWLRTRRPTSTGSTSTRSRSGRSRGRPRSGLALRWMPAEDLQARRLRVRAINDYGRSTSSGRRTCRRISPRARRGRPPWFFLDACLHPQAPPGCRRRPGGGGSSICRRASSWPPGSVSDPAVGVFSTPAGSGSSRTARLRCSRTRRRACVRDLSARRARSAPTTCCALSDPAFDPLVELRRRRPLPADADAADTRRPSFATASRVELDATLERPGLVVLADSFYPGWPRRRRAARRSWRRIIFRGVPVAPARIGSASSTPRGVRLGAACRARAGRSRLATVGEARRSPRRSARAAGAAARVASRPRGDRSR